MKLWVFGDSNSLPFNLAPTDPSWPQIVSDKLGLELVNRAKPAVDNFFIYQSWYRDHAAISSYDKVVIGWSHFSRKMFLKDSNKSSQFSVLPDSLMHEDHGRFFIRSKGPKTDELSKVKTLSPKNTGIDYFDDWFSNYYDEYEQNINFQSYIDSVKLRCPSAVQFFFSRSSIKYLDLTDIESLCILDFILDNRLYISETDCHADPLGHRRWADLILERLNAIPDTV